MKDKHYKFNLLLCVLWGGLMAGFAVWRTVVPAVILPPVDLPLILAVCLMALLLEHLMGREPQRHRVVMAVLAAVAFGLFPLCTGLFGWTEALGLAVKGGLTAWVTALLYDSVMERYAGEGASGAEPVLTALLLFLAGQSLANIFF